MFFKNQGYDEDCSPLLPTGPEQAISSAYQSDKIAFQLFLIWRLFSIPVSGVENSPPLRSGTCK